jgi:hypothetical protein
MICCLLALLVALPGVSMLRRLYTARGQCAVRCGHMAMGHATTRQVAIACGFALAVTGGALIGGLQGGNIVSHPFGPICSAIDRATSAR